MGLGRRWWASVGLLSAALWLAIADFAAILLWGYSQGSRMRNRKLNRTRSSKTEHPGWRSTVSGSALQRAPPFHLTVYLTAS